MLYLINEAFEDYEKHAHIEIMIMRFRTFRLNKTAVPHYILLYTELESACIWNKWISFFLTQQHSFDHKSLKLQITFIFRLWNIIHIIPMLQQLYIAIIIIYFSTFPYSISWYKYFELDISEYTQFYLVFISSYNYLTSIDTNLYNYIVLQNHWANVLTNLNGCNM